jgi:fructose-1,6-bisphosphatase I
MRFLFHLSLFVALWLDGIESFTVTTNLRPLLQQQQQRYSKSALHVESVKTIENAHIVQPRWICPQHRDVCNQTGITLSRYMREMARANPELEEVESIFTALQTATKTISNLVRRSCLAGTTGLEGNVNVQGEEQKKLDVLANDVLKAALKWSGNLGTIASEEEDSPVLVDNRGNQLFSGNVLIEQEGNYVAVFDPLDGSSNVDASIPTGTIFGIFQNDDECLLPEDTLNGDTLDEGERRCLQNTLQPGKNLVAAGYCLYSSSTIMMFTLGNGVHGFTLDESIGEFVLTHPNVRIPNRGKIYSFNESNRWDWDKPMQDYITDIQQGRGDLKARYSSRYIGSMVGDLHRTLLYGGIFGYPADKKNPNGTCTACAAMVKTTLESVLSFASNVLHTL